MSKTIHFAAIITLFTLLSVIHSTVYAIDRIGVRQGANGGEFYNTVTDAKFVPRGNNYYPGIPGTYDPTNMVAQFEQNGYNTVRIFVPDNLLGHPDHKSTMDDLADFLQKASAKNIYTLVVLSVLPTQGGFYPPPPPDSQIEGENLWFMYQPYIDARKKAVQDFIKELQNRGAPTEDILGYELENELVFPLDRKPLSLSSGIVNTAAGQYDMSKPDQKQRVMADNLVNWSNQISSAIKWVEPTALTTISFFPPLPWVLNARLPRIVTINTSRIFIDPTNGGSSIDFVDLHPYPWMGTMAEQMAAFEIYGNHQKPILMGEFGVDKPTYPDLTTAVSTMRDWQVESCNYNVQGWIAWTWDTFGANVTGYYAIEESNGINQVLAPIYRADPCKVENISPTPTPIPSCQGYNYCDSPVNGTTFVQGNTYTIKGWSRFCAGPAGQGARDRVDIHLYDAGTWKNSVQIAGSVASSNRTDTVGICGTQNPNSNGWTYNWTVPLSVPAGNYTLRIAAINDSAATCIRWSACNIIVTTPTPIPKVGDLNGDGYVDTLDYNILVANFGNTTCGNVADINDNCTVDIFDYNVLVGNWGLPAQAGK